MRLPAPEMTSLSTLLHSPSFPSTPTPPQSPSFTCFSKHHRRRRLPPDAVHLTRHILFLPRPQLLCNRVAINRKFHFRAAAGDDPATSTDDEPPRAQDVAVLVHTDAAPSVANLRETVAALPPVAFLMKSCGGNRNAVWLLIASVLVFIAVRVHLVRKSRHTRPGSVADLVRRGQLRYDRRGISKPLKYEDPFNNPFVKVGKSDSTVEMCGKVYRLAPVTLTKEEQNIHQKRRSRAYQWKRPTVFLKEGDSVPPDVDPDTVRWIPANHPFATTASEIDEDLAQNNVYQQHGVPFRIQAEHEALQKKLEALQREQKFNKLVIDTGNARDFERPLKFNTKSNELTEKRALNNQAGDSNRTPKPKSDSAPNPSESSLSSEEITIKYKIEIFFEMEFQEVIISDISRSSSTRITEDLAHSFGPDSYDFQLSELRAITQNFSPNFLLGEGGFGKVHKAAPEILRGVEGFLSVSTKQMETARRLAQDSCKFGTDDCTDSHVARAVLRFGASHNLMENERENLLRLLDDQVCKPLRALITRAPLEDARYLTHRYHKLRQEVEAQMILEEQLSEPSLQTLTTNGDAIVPPANEHVTSNGSSGDHMHANKEDSCFIAKVIHPFDAETEGELSLSI
ncbi:hypothetical protein Tsubulata_038551 [Turnera subulata]|uniref:Protein kinase domain-containing protein n=1 Tax=Turnera subulata TaxID=218843 RepID=A0A9Q0F5A0_9ROSI|nr:hypothetical protein Tsubulata_038551 [Turnera subulata]